MRKANKTRVERVQFVSIYKNKLILTLKESRIVLDMGVIDDTIKEYKRAQKLGKDVGFLGLGIKIPGIGVRKKRKKSRRKRKKSKRTKKKKV